MEILTLVSGLLTTNNAGLIGILIGAIVVLTMIFKRQLNLSFGKFSVSVGGDEKNSAKTNKLNKSHLTSLIEYLLEKITEKSNLREETFIKQMNYVDEKLLTIRNLFLNVFREGLEDVMDSDDIRNTPEYKSYKIVLEDALRECVKGKTLKKTLKTDDLLKLSDQSAWGVYLKQKQTFAWMFLQDHFELNYSEKVINLDKLCSLHDKIKSQFQDEIYDIYEHAKSIANDQSIMIQNIDNDVKNKIEQFQENFFVE